MTEPVANAASKCYRLRRYYLVVGIAGVVFSAIVGCFSTVLAWFNVDGSFANPRFFALVFGVFWSAFTALGIYIILAYFRERLHVSHDCLTAIGCLRTRSLQFADVQRMRWRAWPQGGSIVLRDTATRIVVEFANYTPEERNELIALFRNRMDAERQEGWSRFAVAVVERRPAKTQRSRTAAVLCALAFGGIAVAFVCCWWIGLGVQYLVLGILNAVGFVAYSLSVGYRWSFVADDAHP